MMISGVSLQIMAHGQSGIDDFFRSTETLFLWFIINLLINTLHNKLS